MSICHKNHEMPLCLNCPKFGQLIIRNIISIVATRCKFFGGCTKFDFGSGVAPDSIWEAYRAPLTPWLHLRRPISKGRGGEEEGRVNEKEKEGRKFGPPQSSPQIDATVYRASLRQTVLMSSNKNERISLCQMASITILHLLYPSITGQNFSNKMRH